jgi:hypothetical protein
MKNLIIKTVFTLVFISSTTSLAISADKVDMPMSDEQKMMQAKMMEYSTPNANHEVLKALAGNWTAKVKFWMDPKSEAQESEGTATSKVIMGGRFLEQIFIGSMMGQPFEGRALWGYDNMKKSYTGLWFDSMATGVMISSAQYDPTTKTLTEEGSMSCPMTGETNRWYKAVTTFIDADNYTYESFMKELDGTVNKNMLINYTRAK